MAVDQIHTVVLLFSWELTHTPVSSGELLTFLGMVQRVLLFLIL